jgi:glycosyltransferase involved in cell wall biosynthesis
VFSVGEPAESRPGLRVFRLMSRVFSDRALPSIVSQLRFLILAFLFVSVAFFRRRYLLVHVHNTPDFLVFAALIPRLFGAPVVLDIHDTTPESYATKFDLPLTNPLIGLIRLEERLSAAVADRVITTHDLHRDTLIEHGIAAQKIGIIMNVADESIFSPRSRCEQEDGLTLIYHGTVARRLGLDLILEAIHRARQWCPCVRFILIGHGEDMPRIKEIIRHHDMKNVDIIDRRVTVEKLPDYISRSDVGIVGNRLQTEFRKNWMLPVKMLEYAAMEIPTIAPRLRVIERYFDEDSAMLYEPDNVEDLARCIREAYENPERLLRIQQGLRDFNARYNWRDMERRYLGLVRELTRAGSGGPCNRPEE